MDSSNCLAQVANFGAEVLLDAIQSEDGRTELGGAFLKHLLNGPHHGILLLLEPLVPIH